MHITSLRPRRGPGQNHLDSSGGVCYGPCPCNSAILSHSHSVTGARQAEGALRWPRSSPRDPAEGPECGQRSQPAGSVVPLPFGVRPRARPRDEALASPGPFPDTAIRWAGWNHPEVAAWAFAPGPCCHRRRKNVACFTRWLPETLPVPQPLGLKRLWNPQVLGG